MFPYIYLKVIDDCRYKKFINTGEFHFENLSNFRAMALPGITSDTNSIWGDLNENVFHRELQGNQYGTVNMTILDPISGQIFKSPLNLNESVSLRSKPPLDGPYSLSMIGLDRDDFVSIDGRYCIIKSKTINDLNRMIFNQPRKIVILIYDINFILRRLKFYFDLKNIYNQMGPVLYTINQTLTLGGYDMSKGDPRLPFTKGLEYKYQHEFRFLIDNPFGLDEHNNVHIGNLFGRVHKLKRGFEELRRYKFHINLL